MTYLDHLSEKYQGDFPIQWGDHFDRIVNAWMLAGIISAIYAVSGYIN